MLDLADSGPNLPASMFGGFFLVGPRPLVTYPQFVRLHGEPLDDDGLAPDGGVGVPLLPLTVLSTSIISSKFENSLNTYCI
jgi:hypothetical protein